MSDLMINESIQIPSSEIQWTSVRSQGPGGQNVNKVNTKVVLRWNLGASQALPERARQRMLRRPGAILTRDGWLMLTSQETRSRNENLHICLEKLRALILSALKEPKVRHATRPTAGSQKRRRKDKEELSRKKQQRRLPGGE